jgi:hypothetical protein
VNAEQPATSGDQLADRTAAIAAAIGPAMLLGLQDAELFDEPGAERIRDWVKWISEVVAGLPAAPPAVSSSAPADRAGLRDRIRRAVCEAEGFVWDSDLLEPDEYGEVGDAVLAVLFGPIPAGTDTATWTAIRAIQLMNEAGRRRDVAQAAPVDRSAVLREAADELWALANRLTERGQGVLWAAERLRRLADEAPEPETQAQPPYHRWSVETRDAVADQWTPGTPIADRDKAVERYGHVTTNWPTWKDGTPVRRRLVRATTTYTVETGAAAEAQQPEAAEGAQQ